MFGTIGKTWCKIATVHRSADTTSAGTMRDFFIPRPTKGFFIRMGVVAIVAIIVFGFLLIPCIIDGESMIPTYPAHGFTFCWRGKYLFRNPKRGEVVIICYSTKVYFLKRVVALPGETVEFRRGNLFINGRRQREPYLHYICDWNLPPRTVEAGHYYVVGDNRSQPISLHKFGQVDSKKIAGAPLF